MVKMYKNRKLIPGSVRIDRGAEGGHPSPRPTPSWPPATHPTSSLGLTHTLIPGLRLLTWWNDREVWGRLKPLLQPPTMRQLLSCCLHKHVRSHHHRYRHRSSRWVDIIFWNRYYLL